jgi:hypothetical protein
MDEMIKETKEKKPLLKRWWFWVLAIFFGLAAIGSLIPETEESKALVAAEKAKAEQQAAAEKIKEAERRRQGLHCLSSISGANNEFIVTIMQGLRNPKSFEHIETRIGPVDKSGAHKIAMRYRAENGYGGMAIGYASGKLNNEDCSVIRIDPIK